MALIENLLNLHRVDGQVRALRTRVDAAKRYLDAQSRLLQDVQQQQQELQTRRKHLQATIANSEVEIKGIDQRVEKLRNELNSSPNQKQYSALLNELTTVKDQKKKVEDRLLNEMQDAEKVEEQLAQIATQVQERTKLRDHAAAQHAERVADVGQRLSELEQERRAAAAIIPSDALAQFDEAADLHEGEAMAGVEEISRRNREYACGECNMHLPFELVSQLTSHNNAILLCPSCDRILYMQEEMRGTLAKK